MKISSHHEFLFPGMGQIPPPGKFPLREIPSTGQPICETTPLREIPSTGQIPLRDTFFCGIFNFNKNFKKAHKLIQKLFVLKKLYPTNLLQ